MNTWLARALLVLTALAGAASAVSADATASEIAVRAAWSRATPPGSTVAAVYLTLVGGSDPDRLVAATTTRAAMTQIHVVTETAGMVQMRQTDGVAVPAHATVALAPQGTHLMLLNLQQPLHAGEHFPLTLRFEVAGQVDVQVDVLAPGREPPAPR